MPLIPAICTQCGAKLEVDSGQEAAICPFCHTPFITEKAINNYNTTNITNIGNLHADVLNINDKQSIDNRVKSGETFLKLHDYTSARKIFSELTQDSPYDYRGWWGLIRVESFDFTVERIDRTKLVHIKNWYTKAIAVASPEEQNQIEPQYQSYYNSVMAFQKSAYADIQQRRTYLEAEYIRYKTDKEAEITRLTEERDSIKEPGDILAIIALILAGFFSLLDMMNSGFLWGIVAAFVYFMIFGGIAVFIGNLIGTSARKQIDELSAKIKSVQAELGAYTSKYNQQQKNLTERENSLILVLEENV